MKKSIISCLILTMIACMYSCTEKEPEVDPNELAEAIAVDMAGIYVTTATCTYTDEDGDSDVERWGGTVTVVSKGNGLLTLAASDGRYSWTHDAKVNEKGMITIPDFQESGIYIDLENCVIKFENRSINGTSQFTATWIANGESIYGTVAIVATKK